MEFIPAIDLLRGDSVRLLQGDYQAVTVYEKPIESMARFARSGASWIHVVDLDAARGEGVNNRTLIEQLVDTSSLHFEVGGGVRTVDDVSRLVDIGVERVIVGTKAVSDLALFSKMCDAFPNVVAAGIDYRRINGRRICALNGWLQNSDVELLVAIDRVIGAGSAGVILTDISRDGTLIGPDIETLMEVAAVTSMAKVDLISSGGVSRIGDLVEIGRATSGYGSIFGAISGKAVHEGLIEVGKAVQICKAFE